MREGARGAMDPDIPKEDLQVGKVWCVPSDQGRYGYVVIQLVELHPASTDLEAVTTNHTLWKKPSDP